MGVPEEQVALPGFAVEAPPAGFRYTRNGHEVLCCGNHYADAAHSDAAANIVDAMNAVDFQKDWAALISRIK